MTFSQFPSLNPMEPNTNTNTSTITMYGDDYLNTMLDSDGEWDADLLWCPDNSMFGLTPDGGLLPNFIGATISNTEEAFLRQKEVERQYLKRLRKKRKARKQRQRKEKKKRVAKAIRKREDETELALEALLGLTKAKGKAKAKKTIRENHPLLVCAATKMGLRLEDMKIRGKGRKGVPPLVAVTSASPFALLVSEIPHLGRVFFLVPSIGRRVYFFAAARMPRSLKMPCIFSFRRQAFPLRRRLFPRACIRQLHHVFCFPHLFFLLFCRFFFSGHWVFYSLSKKIFPSSSNMSSSFMSVFTILSPAPFPAAPGQPMLEEDKSHGAEGFFAPALFRELVSFFTADEAASIGDGFLLEEEGSQLEEEKEEEEEEEEGEEHAVFMLVPAGFDAPPGPDPPVHEIVVPDTPPTPSSLSSSSFSSSFSSSYSSSFSSSFSASEPPT